MSIDSFNLNDNYDVGIFFNVYFIEKKLKYCPKVTSELGFGPRPVDTRISCFLPVEMRYVLYLSSKKKVKPWMVEIHYQQSWKASWKRGDFGYVPR